MFVEFLQVYLPIIIYILLIVFLSFAIILTFKLIMTMDKIDKVVDSVSNKVESLNGLFKIIDFITDGVSGITDKVNESILGITTKIFHKKDKKESDEDEKE